jgi:O-antigen ligase
MPSRVPGAPDGPHTSDSPAQVKRTQSGVVVPLFAVAIVAAGYFVGGRQAMVLCGLLTPFLLIAGLGLQRAGITVILAAVALAPATALLVVPPPPLIPTTDILLVLGFAMLLPTLHDRRVIIPAPYAAGALLLLLLGLLSVAMQPDPYISIPWVLRITFASIALPLGFLIWRPDLRELRLIAYAYLVGSVASVGNALMVGPVDGNRYDGLTDHPNAFGLSMLMALSLVPFALRLTSQRRQWLVVLAAAICLYGMWISGSRAALVALVLLCLLYLVIEQSTGMLGLGLAGVVVVGLASSQLAADEDSAFGRLLGGTTAGASDKQRVKALDGGIENFLSNPYFGSGLEHIREAHNIYVQVAASLGIFALAGFLLMVVTLAFALFIAPRPRHLLGFPALAFAVVGPLTDILWDSLLWVLVPLALLAVPTASEQRAESTAEPDPEGAA